MMTFKDLKKLVELPSYKEQRVPTVKALEVSGVPVVTEKVLENHGSINMSCARVKQYTASDVSKAERHNERKNETYENMNVIVERIPFNVHFKKPTAPTYMEQLKQMETDGMVSLRGLRKDATLFDEIVIDVNTMYFERNGGYEYAKQFYEEAYHFIEEKFGADNVISAVIEFSKSKRCIISIGQNPMHSR